MNNSMPSHYAIFDFWKDKAIRRDGTVVARRNKAPDDEVVVEDWGEPCCWGCGKPVRKLYGLKSFDDMSLKERWNHGYTTALLNRCHIIPRMLGGTFEPGNVFLMCEECHVLSPDTDNPHNFMRWVYRHREETWQGHVHPELLLRRISEEMVSAGYPDVATVMEIADIHRVGGREEKIDKTLLEFLYKHIGMHGASISETSIIYATADYYKDIYNNLIS